MQASDAAKKTAQATSLASQEAIVILLDLARLKELCLRSSFD